MLTTETNVTHTIIKVNTRAKLKEVLEMDLGFHDEDSAGMTHDFHAFPAKFPPQLPRAFIHNLTRVGERVLDPMMGSGTCVLEAFASGRVGIGFDIDPLAVLLTKVKVNPVNSQVVQKDGLEIADRAERVLNNGIGILDKELKLRFEPKTFKFVDYWFSLQTQLELASLIREIDKVGNSDIKKFLQMVFSAIIITKSGGVSLAWDLAHTRPHKLKQGVPKSYRPAIKEFRKRLLKNISGLHEMTASDGKAFVLVGNAENLPLANNSIDLLFTSPPYASNAIDYMRAHKFSLVWFENPLDELSDLRSKYIGGEKTADYPFLEFPTETTKIISKIARADEKKGLSLRRYYSEMKRVLSQSLRVLRPGKAAVFVVGSSTMRGIDTQTQNCIGEIGKSLGFDLVGIATRKLDRDRRMLPASLKKCRNSQIEDRMHEEYVVALVKPMNRTNNDGKN